MLPLPQISPHLLLFLWALLGLAGIVGCLMALARPHTNQTAVLGLLIFFGGWMVECVAHSLVALLGFSPAYLLWGASISSLAFIAGFLSSGVGLLIHLRNEHRYRRGFWLGIAGALLNGWILSHAGTTWINGRFEDLAGGMVIRLISPQTTALAGLPRREQPEPTAISNAVAARQGALRLSEALQSFLSADRNSHWKTIALKSQAAVSRIHPGSQVLLFTPEGPSWLSLSLQKRPDASPRLLPGMAEAAAARLLREATAAERRGASRVVISGFETSRLRHVGTLPSLPGPHAFEHWTASGDGWMVEAVLWSPSAGARKLERQAREVVTTLLRIASEQGLSGTRRPAEIETLFQDAAAHWARGQPEQAVPLWEEACRRLPADAEIAVALATAYEALKRTQDAHDLLEERRLLLSASDAATAMRAHLRAGLGDAKALAELHDLLQDGFSDDRILSDYLSLLSAQFGPGLTREALAHFGGRHAAQLVEEWKRRLAAVSPAPTAGAGTPAAATTVAASPQPHRTLSR